MPNAGGVKPKLAAGCLYLFAAPFCGLKQLALMDRLANLLAGNLPQAAYGRYSASSLRCRLRASLSFGCAWARGPPAARDRR